MDRINGLVVAPIAISGMPCPDAEQQTAKRPLNSVNSGMALLRHSDPIGCGPVERADQVLPAASNVGTSVTSMTFMLVKAAPPAASGSNAGGARAAGAAAGAGLRWAAKRRQSPRSAFRQINQESWSTVGHRVEIAGTSIYREVTQGHGGAGTTVVDPVASAAAASAEGSIKASRSGDDHATSVLPAHHGRACPTPSRILRVLVELRLQFVAQK